MRLKDVRLPLATRELARWFHPDFRFGAPNLMLLVGVMAAGAALQGRVDPAPGARVPPDVLGLCASVAMGATLVVAPLWTKVIGLGVVYWLVLRFVYDGVALWPTHAAAYLGLLLATSLQVAKQWEKGVVLRLGKFRALGGPGLFGILPLVDRVDRTIDHRVRATDFRAETTLTKDTVPVNVDAIAFWLVWDAKMSVLEVADYEDAVILSAQTALRDAIGKHELADMLSAREKLGQEIQVVLDRKTDPWGITIQAIEIRDIIIPRELEDAMSRQAQAERERQSRVILGTAETEIAAKFAAASEAYRDNPVALHLRAMNMVFEGLKQKGSMIIVPSTAVETMGLGALGGLTAFDRPGGSERGSERAGRGDAS
jgi:regulator of protease activity HflC (stomatin/prohibitin superfamily)